MHEKSPLLKASNRERLGSRYSERYRKQGKLPAVVYGHGREPLPIALEAKEALRLIAKGEKVFRLDFPGSKAADEMQMVLLKDLQFDYLGSNIVHADFARVDLNERVRTKVHVVLTGEAIGMKTAGAILIHPTTELVIECRVIDLPDHVEVAVGELDLGQTITADKVKLPTEDMKLITDPHAIVAQIVLGVELKTDEATAVTAEGAAAPEVLTAKKDDAAKPAAGAKGAAPAKGGAAAKGAAPAAKPAGGKK